MSVDELALAGEEKVVVPPDGYPDEPVYEVIDGVRVELPMSARNDFLANEATQELAALIRPRRMGQVVHEMLFELPLADRSRRRRPDIAFVSLDRWAADRPLPERGNHWPVAPDLAVEFISPTDEVRELMDKLRDYFDAGVRQVWVVHPDARLVQVYESLALARGFHESAEIDGGDILPGIRVPVAVMLPPRPVA
ncbi:MAG TPA: Uma2 family endonuclease [Gemmataceae bacterium]|nr:Uma2 family endonuclease [Gemmataceae bacterium]